MTRNNQNSALPLITPGSQEYQNLVEWLQSEVGQQKMKAALERSQAETRRLNEALKVTSKQLHEPMTI